MSLSMPESDSHTHSAECEFERELVDSAQRGARRMRRTSLLETALWMAAHIVSFGAIVLMTLYVTAHP